MSSLGPECSLPPGGENSARIGTGTFGETWADQLLAEVNGQQNVSYESVSDGLYYIENWVSNGSEDFAPHAFQGSSEEGAY
jgi:hypothetical protein